MGFWESWSTIKCSVAREICATKMSCNHTQKQRLSCLQCSSLCWLVCRELCYNRSKYNRVRHEYCIELLCIPNGFSFISVLDKEKNPLVFQAKDYLKSTINLCWISKKHYFFKYITWWYQRQRAFLLPCSSNVLKRKDAAVWVGKGTGNGRGENRRTRQRETIREAGEGTWNAGGRRKSNLTFCMEQGKLNWHLRERKKRERNN